MLPSGKICKACLRNLSLLHSLQTPSTSTTLPIPHRNLSTSPSTSYPRRPPPPPRTTPYSGTYGLKNAIKTTYDDEEFLSDIHEANRKAPVASDYRAKGLVGEEWRLSDLAENRSAAVLAENIARSKHAEEEETDEEDGRESGSASREGDEGEVGRGFGDVVPELLRRKRLTESKRRQGSTPFLDYLVITARGGKGGAGASSFGLAARSGGMGSPSGGNGGPGGRVYLTTSDRINSLAPLQRAYNANSGGSGGGDRKHGSRGQDTYISVPIGTVIRETRRDGEPERAYALEQEMELDVDEKRKRRWERWFIHHPSVGVEDVELKRAEDRLREHKIWVGKTPTFDEQRPFFMDVKEEITEPVLISPGGLGGMGNPFFAGLHPWRPPKLASKGTIPPTMTLQLELKLLADVGFVGLPNVGKSTILRALTGRRAEVAGYEFTTLNPQVGVVRVWDDGSWGGGGVKGLGDEVVLETWEEREEDMFSKDVGEYKALPRAGRVRSQREIEETEGEVDGLPISPDKLERVRFTISDNPGLLPEASANVGLGHSFLRSIERSLALAYIIDLSRPNPASDLQVLRNELETYKPGLPSRGAVVVLNKADQVDEEAGKDKYEKVRSVVEGLEEGMEIVVLSGKFGLGLDGLVRILAERVEQARKVEGDKSKAEVEADEEEERRAMLGLRARYDLEAEEKEKQESAHSSAERM